MKPRIGYFFWILVLAFGLMILVAATQLLTKRNISGLKKGNREAVITFTINNRLQDLVNLCFELETKVINSASTSIRRQSLTDSLTMLGYHASVLSVVNPDEDVIGRFKNLNRFINQQVEASLRVLQSKGAASFQLVDSLRSLQVSDSVYSTALAIQKFLERDLQNTLDNNTAGSTRLTAYNRTLAIIAIAAVLILGTIIINRHLRQMQLIAELEKATAIATNSAMIKEQFLANMSHEIRTPLNAIKGFSRLMSQTSLSGAQQQYAGIITDASTSLIHIVNDILDISKIEAGKLKIEAKEFNLKKILQTIEYLFLNAAGDKKLKYFQHINDDVHRHLKGDPERLSQILINLVSNGIKFTQSGYVSTSVSLLKETDDTVWIQFQVEDSGIGIPEDKHAAIFQRFEQLETNDNNVKQGTGLGLSIVKSLATLMGGSITVASNNGEGSVFKVQLPFKKLNDPVGENATNIENLIPAYYYTGASVLVVEDNKINKLLLKHTLAGLDITAKIVSNGQEALNAIREKEYDLILLDIQMPVMDGYATIQAIRKKEKNNTPVVAMTAYAMPGEKEKCLAAGMNDYLAKPIEYSQLIAVFEKFLKINSSIINRMPGEGTTSKEDFLLVLAGGDKKIVKRILEEIHLEIPKAESKLNQIRDNKDFDSINGICHYMISSFAPMGTETPVMKKIQQLRNIKYEPESNNSNIIILIDGLVQELHRLESELEEKIYNPN